MDVISVSIEGEGQLRIVPAFLGVLVGLDDANVPLEHLLAE